MLTVSELYKQINAMPGRIVEYKCTIQNDAGTAVEYAGSAIVENSVNITAHLYSEGKFSVGGVGSAKLEIEVKPGSNTIKTMAEIHVFARLRKDNLVSEWLPQGIYYIDSRTENKDPVTNEVISVNITAYDAMRKADSFLLDVGEAITNWPRPMSTLVNEIAQYMGVQLESGTSISSSLTCQADYSYTRRDYLSDIAKAHAGNWIITYEGKLRLVKIFSEFSLLSTEDYIPITFGGVGILV